MRVETRKTLILTKEEKRAIDELYEVFDKDESINALGVWYILTDIYTDDDAMAQQYGYNIEIVD